MKKRLKWLFALFAVMIVLVGLFGNRDVRADVTESNIAYIEKVKDLIVSFDFDKEVVDITFISPSGSRLTKNSRNVEYAEDTLWAVYRIHDAEIGQWKVEYDIGANRTIDYSVIDDDFGLWIKDFTIGSLTSASMTVSFSAESGDVDSYNYELYADSQDGSNESTLLVTGWSWIDSNNSLTVRLNDLSSGDYKFRLEIYGYAGDTEVFDSAVSKAVTFNNPYDPEAIDNFRVYVDQEKKQCTVDWADFASYSYNGYRLAVYVDGQSIYENELDYDEYRDSFNYDGSATELRIELKYKMNYLWSYAKVKTVRLTDEYLALATSAVTSSTQIEIKYKTGSERELHVNINGVSGLYRITKEDILAFNAVEGRNTVSASMEADDLVNFVIETEVYVDLTPPRIIMYEDLDGKTFFDENVTIMGRIEGGNTLAINGKEAEMSEKYEFKYSAGLDKQENTFEFVATDANGNEARKVVTLYKGNEAEAAAALDNTGDEPVWKKYLPLILAVVGSILIFFIALIFIKKRGGKWTDHIMGDLILWDVVILVIEAVFLVLFIRKHSFGMSMEFLDLAEKSPSDAAEWIRQELLFRKCALIGGIVLGASALVTAVWGVILTIRKKKHNTEEQNEGI